MAQFTIYSSADAGAPQISGAAGTLLAVLDAILVTGYGAQVAAGWTKPIANAGNCGHYLQGAGSGFHLFINDNGPNATSTFKEAWATGWETMATIAAPVGTGTGQFPTPAQLLATGHTSIRKSTDVSGTARPWICFADSRTVYLFIQTGDTAAVYYHLWFGDCYSIKNAADAYNCFIVGGAVENSSTAANHPWDLQNNLTTAAVGHFVARSYGGGGASLLVSKHGDLAKAGSGVLLGLIPVPNGPDSAFYLSPLWLVESASGNVRGRFRGLYHLPHAIASFTDGQVFSGAVDYAGKDFRVVLKGPSNGMVVVETSNTLETN
jgi:hypothetical protein